VPATTTGRKQIVKVLSTGQQISLTPQDDRTLKMIYDFIAGYAKRMHIERILEEKKREVEQLKHEIPPGAKLLMKERANKGRTASTSNNVENDADNVADDENEEKDPVKTEGEIKVDNYYKAREVLLKLEEKLKLFLLTDHKISFKDLDAVIKSLGKTLTKRQIDQMIWEVDENLDEMIDYEELQLTYYRNITDTTGNEPCLFFKLLDFMIFDGSHKGYIIEDDCMEILYARFGGGYLEREMKLLFGNRLRAEGGDGTLNLEAFLDSVFKRIGKRALVC